jgi:hypothetical protein
MFIRDIDPLDKNAIREVIAELEALPEDDAVRETHLAGFRAELAALEETALEPVEP